jgi:plastocyanin
LAGRDYIEGQREGKMFISNSKTRGFPLFSIPSAPVLAMLASAVSLALSLAPRPALAGKDPEYIARICEKAARRYEKIFGHSPASEKIRTVIMYKYTFCPQQVTIRQGESVRWVNVDYTSHSTWFRQAGKPESERLFRKESSVMKFDLPPGEYPYLGSPHWQSDDMRGKVIVIPAE